MRRWCSLLALSALVACRGTSDTTVHPAPSASASAPSIDASALTLAEIRRDSSAIGENALSSRDPELRRAAARALARIADARAVELLTLSLADEDGDVITWSAYGLGFACKHHEAKLVYALVARAASLPETASAHAPLASPPEAIADALGRCGGSEAESSLRAWLEGPKPRAEAAALALGRIASQSGRLDDTTSVALLAAADRPQNAVENALYPFTRLTQLNESTQSRVRELAQRAIAHEQPAAEFAVRALAHTGEEGAKALGAMLAERTRAPHLRAEAARELAALGPNVQPVLWNAFDALASAEPRDEELLDPSYGAFSALISALAPPVPGVSAKLRALAELPLGPNDAPSLKRRKLHLRCNAAALLVGANFRDARLASCDPSPESRERELVALAVIAREPIRGARKQAYLTKAAATDAVVREAALGLLAAHAEISEGYRLLSEALSAKSLGVVASAAHVLASYPERATRAPDRESDARSAPNPDPSVVQALTRAFDAAREHHNVEVQSSLLDAAGALQILSLKANVNQACTSDNPTLREHAEKSLRLLGEQTRRCDRATPDANAKASAPPWPKTQLSFDTDAGPLTLTLDATFAPNAVARIVALAQAGFYDGLGVHRVVPGFVAQFGDPGEDGYGGDDRPPLRCETSPIAFGAGSLGVALAGRDTGSSQFFVTFGRYPHLDGEYAWLGQAGPGWEKLAPGDRILHVKAAPLP